MYISKIELKNIRCFDQLLIDFEKDRDVILWTTLLGDNSTGKTTILRCIAIGLCDESSAAGLLRESEEGYIRNDAKGNGIICITIYDNSGLEKGKIITKIEKVTKDGTPKFLYEHLTQTIEGDGFNPGGEIFICAYGIGRGVSGTGDISGYSPISAVYNLFNYSEGLQNPELVIRRRNSKQKELFQIIKAILDLPENSKIRLDLDGIKISGGKWEKQMAIRDIADGYKSTFQWIMDLLGWMISYYGTDFKRDKIEGIVLVDALEEHLHPKWQKKIVSVLRNQFPAIQFITSSHSPIVARSVGDLSLEKKNIKEQLVLLELEEGNRVIGKNISLLKGLGLDQIIASEAFDYQLINSEEDKILMELSKLVSKGKNRTLQEENKYRYALDIATNFEMTNSVSLFEREVSSELQKKRRAQIKELEAKLFNNDKNK